MSIFVKEDEKKSVGIIFGKFYPAHVGHIWFIRRVSTEVKKLYVVVCSETERDEKLFLESTMPIKPTVWDRMRFIEEEMTDVDNVEILHLNEDNIEAYPNGWEKWSNRVEELLTNKKIVVDVVFTNEIQDVENYKKYFAGRKCFNDNLKVVNVDLNRKMFNISATKVRNDFFGNWNFLPNSVQKYFENYRKDKL